MFRSLIPVVVYFTAVTSAPQAGNSDITYVKIQPLDRLTNQAPAKSPYRESRIELLPLTISGNNNSTKLHDEEFDEDAFGNTRFNDTASREIEIASEVNVSKENISEEVPDEANVSSEIIQDIVNGNKDDQTVVKIKDDDNHKIVSKSNSQENNRHARSQEVTELYESETTTTEVVTERVIEELAKKTDKYETRTRAPAPRFISKLSYFSTQDRTPSLSTNLVERPAKRRFKSKCRCEKIWNCPKLQITVPRCPNEYFLCCF